MSISTEIREWVESHFKEVVPVFEFSPESVAFGLDLARADQPQKTDGATYLHFSEVKRADTQEQALSELKRALNWAEKLPSGCKLYWRYLPTVTRDADFETDQVDFVARARGVVEIPE